MHATKKIGLIAGGGEIPALLVRAWLAAGLSPIVISLDDEQSRIYRRYLVVLLFLAVLDKPEKLFNILSPRCGHLVMIGTIRRPNFWTLRTDALGLKIILQLLFKVMGDNRLLTFMREQLEAKGFTIHAAQEYLPEILSPEGVMTITQPTSDDRAAIMQAIAAVKEHGRADKGQAAVMCDGAVAGFEDEKGTNALISRYGSMAGRKILVKMAKPQQDMALDAPTIGVHTIERLKNEGFVGLVVESGRTIVVDRPKVIELCNQYNMFLVGWA